jgi:hypothetical protein
VAGCPKNVFSTCVDVVLLSLESSGFRGKRGSVRFVGILYELRTRGDAVVSAFKHQQLKLEIVKAKFSHCTRVVETPLLKDKHQIEVEADIRQEDVNIDRRE